MAKKKKNKSFILSAVAALLGVISILMIFLPAISIKDSETTYSGLQIVFGFTENGLLGKIVHFEFSFMNLLTYILIAVGVVFTVLGAMGKGSKFALFIALACFAVGAIFFFMQVAFCVPNKDLESVVSGLGGLFNKDASIKDSLSLAVGSIISAICAILSAIVLAYKIFVK
ncbi:MAG: hypothetical protein IJB32_04580 [Clostridia bacterium]|nr:hypothetical protein [Clostridia bacterium]